MEYRARVVYERDVINEAARRFVFRSIRWDGFAVFFALVAALGYLLATGDRSWIVGFDAAAGELGRGDEDLRAGPHQAARRPGQLNPRAFQQCLHRVQRHPPASLRVLELSFVLVALLGDRNLCLRVNGSELDGHTPILA